MDPAYPRPLGSILRKTAAIAAAIVALWAAPAHRLVASESEPDPARPIMRGVFADAFGAQFRDHLSAERLVDELLYYNVQHCFLQVAALGEGFFASDILPPPAGSPIGYDDALGDILAGGGKISEAKSAITWCAGAWLQPSKAQAWLAQSKGFVHCQ